MKRKEFIRLAAPAILLLANGRIVKAHDNFISASQKAKISLRFVVASDGHYGEKGTDYQNYFSTLVSSINEDHARHPFEFAVVNGDIVHDDKIHYPAAKKALDGFACKYYVSQGNHDNVTHSEWESIWGMPVNFDFKHGKNAFLVGTTSNEKGEYLCPDVNWFKEKLQEHKDSNVFVFVHINPIGLTDNAKDCPELFDLFAKHGKVKAVFNGHDHDVEDIRLKEKIPFIFDAHFGGSWGTSYRGYRVVEIMKDGSAVTYIMNPKVMINKASIS